MITKKRATHNLRKYLKRATKQQWKDGSVWYRNANRFCRTLAVTHNRTLEEVAGALAALSPRCSWPENLRATLALVKHGHVGTSLTFPANQLKAWSILYEGLKAEDVLGGEKVKAFYDNIVRVDQSPFATIDTHAARAVFDKPRLTRKQESWVFRKPGNAVCQSAYQQVAKEFRLSVCEAQAIIWLSVKDSLKRIPEHEQKELYIK